ncbi:uncharacterized protein BDZ83DRAFT_1376 [Colletotrichum acutatum]|uniref:Uncharacterized protein n=1 Tax=Glomerella acutata TaxID=27357 RepID=A0AAD8XQJ4_GLOAC|nr:uncharacterized protein BDZ83DRAFT_1376 [Colletotrichum acutatum]KAK1731704.1 hypothetical protein BDZ83DRAFT_1376 [Colletotrichum acutatum]
MRYCMCVCGFSSSRTPRYDPRLHGRAKVCEYLPCSLILRPERSGLASRNYSVPSGNRNSMLVRGCAMFMRLVTTVEWCVISSYMTSLVRLVGVENLEGGLKAHTSTRLWFGRRLPRCSPEDDELRNEYGSGLIVVTLCGSGGVLLLISSLEHRPCAL